jgi:hypothetical protein
MIEFNIRRPGNDPPDTLAALRDEARRLQQDGTCDDPAFVAEQLRQVAEELEERFVRLLKDDLEAALDGRPDRPRSRHLLRRSPSLLERTKWRMPEIAQWGMNRTGADREKAETTLDKLLMPDEGDTRA